MLWITSIQVAETLLPMSPQLRVGLLIVLLHVLNIQAAPEQLTEYQRTGGYNEESVAKRMLVSSLLQSKEGQNQLLRLLYKEFAKDGEGTL